MINFPIHTEAYRREKEPFFTDVWTIQKVSTDSDGWELPPSMQNHAVLLYVESGSLLFSLNGELFSLNKGETLCADVGTRLGLRSSRGESSCFYLVRFDSSDLHFFIGEKNFHTVALPSGIMGAFADMYHSTHQAKYDSISSDCYLLLILQSIKQSFNAIPAQQKLYDEVCVYISEHAKEDPSTEQIADALGFNKDHICRVVKRCSGKTLSEMIAAERINIAKGLLATTNYSLEKIAALLNFSGANSFLKFFKYHVSMTPSEYRRKK
ncbi:MAG: helix-turn-helix transcriptional regulator [Ruminococcaceae bacterium]|nr:helix-turn-helix transcriptional regulator [Oscillospiraceae bacterium]